MVTFEELCSTMDDRGVEVRLRLQDDGRHVLELRDLHRVRSLTHEVTRSFDATVSALCCSLALCADCGLATGEGARLAAQWPELADLARRRVAGR